MKGERRAAVLSDVLTACRDTWISHTVHTMSAVICIHRHAVILLEAQVCTDRNLDLAILFSSFCS